MLQQGCSSAGRPPASSRGGRRQRTACASAVVVLACLHLVVATASAHEPPSSQSSYHDGRLVVLDHYRLDGSHSHSYVLHTPADELLSVVAPGQELEEFKTNDAVRLWLTAAVTGADSSSSSSSSTTEQASDDTVAHGGSRRAAAEDGPSTGSQVYVVQRAQALPKSWFVPGDSASIWGDSTTWDVEDPVLPDDADDATGSPQVSPSPPPGRLGQGENELAAIIAEGLAASTSAALTASATAQILALPYTRTTKVVSDMSMIVYVMDICGKGGGPATTAAAVSGKVINGTLGPYVSACSRDIGLVSPGNTRVLDVKLGCTGTLSTGDQWTYNSCSGDNLMRLAYAADEYAETVAGINPRKFRHHVLVLPKRANEWMGSTCNWAGTAVLGFSSPAWTYLWIAGEVWDSPQLYLHEMGHNYMLGHSNRLRAAATCTNPLAEPLSNVVSHGDMTSAMGYCCQMRCFHAPHAWQMGWSQAVAALDSTQLTPGATLQFFLPPQMSARRNFITVTTNWVPPPPPAPPPLPAPPQPSPLPSGIIRERLSAANPSADESSQAEESSLVDYAAVGDSERSSDIVLVSVNATTMQHDQSAPAGQQTSDTPVVQEEVFPSPHTFWLSWRPRAPPFDLPVPEYQDALLIHLYDGLTQSDALETFEQGRVTPGGGPNLTVAWRDVAYGSGLVVRLIDTQSGSGGSAGGAWVSVCRASHQSEKDLCHDGLDNDCNGLTDAEDPACQRRAPPPGSRARTSATAAKRAGPPSPPQRSRRRRRALRNDKAWA